jgi:hypothetical protein
MASGRHGMNLLEETSHYDSRRTAARFEEMEAKNPSISAGVSRSLSAYIRPAISAAKASAMFLKKL